MEQGVANEDNFREVFKYYKQKKPPPDLSGVTDVRRLTSQKDCIDLKPFSVNVPNRPLVPGLRPVDSWKVFAFPSHPGFLLISNPFVPFFDKTWAKRCLKDYTCKPNRSNLDSHEVLASGNLWQTCMSDSCKRQNLLSRLHWVTLGYHHNWDTKVYGMDDHSTMPEDLGEMSRYVANAIGFPSYSPEAAIVNFYPVGSTLSGHTDHSEFDQESPIISFSFGCTAIFLLGGETKSTKPMPIYLRSGDIAVMFGPCRLNYHGVARIIPDSWPSDSDFQTNTTSSGGSPMLKSTELHEESENRTMETVNSSRSSLENGENVSRNENNGSVNSLGDNTGRNELQAKDEEDLLVEEYLTKCRINVSVRQVFVSDCMKQS